MQQTVRVLIECEDMIGLVYKISQVFYDFGLNIDENQEFVDQENQRFFMRTVVTGAFEVDVLTQALQQAIDTDADIKVVVPDKKKIVLLATKEKHCLGDLLIRQYDGELDADVVAVVSNHEILKDLVEKFDIPFFVVSADGLSREQHEQAVRKVLDDLEFDYMVLAKYMRILSAGFVGHYAEKIINIHHSFLPSFVGANPYKQAWQRGVKIIGATAHFVTNDLDEGPIIAQDVINASHRDTWQSMRNTGQDVEKVVLSKALQLVLSDRVFIDNNKTIIL